MVFLTRTVLALAAAAAFLLAPNPVLAEPPTKGSVELAPELADVARELGKKYALAIGVQEYAEKPLPYATEDARQVGALLETRYGFEVEYLTAKHETNKVSIENAFEKLMKKVTSSDQVIIFFSGHGDAIRQGERITGGYLIPVDGKPDSFSTLIPMTDIKFMATNLSARHTLFIIDSCYSGVAGGVVSMDASGEQTLAFVRAKMGSRGRQLMTAGKSGERAQMMDDLGMSVYSFYLTKGLQGCADQNHDNVITMSELQAYVEVRVNAKTKGTQNPQYRDFIEEGDGQFVFVPKKRNTESQLEQLRAELKRQTEERQRLEAIVQELKDQKKIAELKQQIAEEMRRGEQAQLLARELAAERQTVELRSNSKQKQKLPTKGKVLTNYLGMKFVYIEPGNFNMGSQWKNKKQTKDEIPHRVRISKGFYLGTTEVTNRQYAVFLNTVENVGKNIVQTLFGSQDHPVTNISWREANAFANWLSQRTGDFYRLPTEAEWEYAARAGSKTAFSNGDIVGNGCGYDPNLNAMGWYCGNARKSPHPVGRKRPNSWGLYDMHGNVWEWCSDWRGAYQPGDVIDPQGPQKGLFRVVRGGSWLNDAEDCRSAKRNGLLPDLETGAVGFRLVLLPGQ